MSDFYNTFVAKSARVGGGHGWRGRLSATRRRSVEAGSVASEDDTPAPIASFGPYRLYPTERRLERDDEAVVIGSRSLEILIALVERAGKILSQRELIARVWPNIVVEEVNLRVHILGLRKVLGDGKDGVRYVANVPGRGYCFVAPVERVVVALRALPVTQPGRVLPPRPMRMVGRAEAVSELSSLLRSRRLVSVVGAGGMGKTTVAVAVVHALLDDFENAVFFIAAQGCRLAQMSAANELG